MSTETERFTVIFPDWYDQRCEWETPDKGWLSNVVVLFDNGLRYGLSFIDPVRLQQDLADDVRRGRMYFAEPNLVVLWEVTTDSIRKAVEGLVQEDFFEHLKPH